MKIQGFLFVSVLSQSVLFAKTVQLKCTPSVMSTYVKCQLEEPSILLSYEDAKLQWFPENIELDYRIEYTHPCKGHKTGLSFSTGEGESFISLRRSKKEILSDKISGTGDLKIVDSDPCATYKAILIGDCAIDVLRVSIFPKVETLRVHLNYHFQKMQDLQKLYKGSRSILNQLEAQGRGDGLLNLDHGEGKDLSVMGLMESRLEEISEFILDEDVKETLLQELFFLKDLRDKHDQDLCDFREGLMQHAQLMLTVSEEELRKTKQFLQEVKEALEEEIEYLETNKIDEIQVLNGLINILIEELK